MFWSSLKYTVYYVLWIIYLIINHLVIFIQSMEKNLAKYYIIYYKLWLSVWTFANIFNITLFSVKTSFVWFYNIWNSPTRVLFTSLIIIIYLFFLQNHKILQCLKWPLCVCSDCKWMNRRMITKLYKRTHYSYMELIDYL